MADFAKAYKLRRFRLQYVRIDANSFFPKTVITRCVVSPARRPIRSGYMNVRVPYRERCTISNIGSPLLYSGYPINEPRVGMTLEIPEDPARTARPDVEVWAAELGALRGDPNVMKFLELQERIDESAPSALDDAQPLPWVGLLPYDLYDVFEFARDLAGTQVSAQRLLRLARGRFPEMSGVGRHDILHFLLNHGDAEVTRRTAAGRPAVYRFPLRAERGTGRGRSVLGLPTNELSRLKGEDLEDVIEFPRPHQERA